MGLTFEAFEALRPHLQASAYLFEIFLAEALFLRPFPPREGRRALSWAGLVIMFLAGTITGIPQGHSMARFLWYFLLMAWRVACAVYCFQGSPSVVSAACMAGFATQHIANKATLLIRLIPAVGLALGRAPVLNGPLEVLVFAAVYSLIYVVFTRRVHPGSGSRHLDVLSATITVLCIGVNRLVADNASVNVQYEAAVCIYAIIGCVFALIIQVYISRWEEERSQALIMGRLLADSEKQYEQWKNSAAQLRIAAHDVRHMLDRIQALAEQSHLDLPDLGRLRGTVDSSSAVRTGSDVLDILLRSMADQCVQNGIALNCTVYTDQLKHFDGMSLYFLFANAIDNAIRSAAQVDDPDKRIIDVSIRQFGGSVVVHIWNYYAGALAFADGLPVTQDDSHIHGFGMKSIRFMVERLGGVLNVHAEGQVFNLDVMLPLKEPEQKETAADG